MRGGGVSKDDTSTERERGIKTTRTRGTWNICDAAVTEKEGEWGHGRVVSYLGRQAYQQKTQHQARCQQSVWNRFLSPLRFFLSPQNFCFLFQKSKKKIYIYKERNNFQLRLYTGLDFQRLKGTLLFCLWFAGTLFQWWNGNRKYTYPKKMARERNNRSGGENETSHQIKQLLANSEKLEKKGKTKRNKTKK